MVLHGAGVWTYRAYTYYTRLVSHLQLKAHSLEVITSSNLMTKGIDRDDANVNKGLKCSRRRKGSFTAGNTQCSIVDCNMQPN